jgi:DNA-binding PadR family transcriptional regulator
MFRYLVLGLLRDGQPKHGYAIRREYISRSGVEINSGSFYRELQRLVDDRLLRVADGRRVDDRRTPYAILDAGRSVFDRWICSRLGDLEAGADDELGSRAVFLARAERERVRAALSEWQEQLWIAGKMLERERVTEASLAATDEFPARSLLVARRIKYVAADLEFVADTAALYDAWCAARDARESGSPAPAAAEPGPAPAVESSVAHPTSPAPPKRAPAAATPAAPSRARARRSQP